VAFLFGRVESYAFVSEQIKKPAPPMAGRRPLGTPLAGHLDHRR